MPDYDPKEGKPEAPEAIRLRNLCLGYHTLWNGGGMAEQPWLLMWEWSVCDEAEEEYRRFERINAEAAERAKRLKKR